MTIKPILFNTEMVRAILDERKAATRRVVKGAKSEWRYEGLSDDAAVMAVDRNGMEYAKPVDGLWATFEGDDGPIDFPMVKAPYCPGDILYVRETWRLVDFDCIDTDWSASVQYKADMAKGERWHDLSPDERIGWRPSIHMPREAARIWLRVTDVRVERLQEIECIATEGITMIPADNDRDPRFYFIQLWDSTIKPADRERYGWAASPWVWVIEFERCEKPEEG